MPRNLYISVRRSKLITVTSLFSPKKQVDDGHVGPKKQGNDEHTMIFAHYKGEGYYYKGAWVIITRVIGSLQGCLVHSLKYREMEYKHVYVYIFITTYFRFK